MPTPQELASMKDDLNFKENEMEKSKYTASGLAGGGRRLMIRCAVIIHYNLD